MNIIESTIGSFRVLTLQGQVKGSDAVELRQVVQMGRERGLIQVAIDLKDVSFIDSSGVGMLIHCLQELKKVGGDLVLLRLSEDIQDLFEMVAMDRLFTILPDFESLRRTPVR